MLENHSLFVVKISDLAVCRRCGNVYSRHVGVLAVGKCPSCDNVGTPDNVEL